MINPKHRQEWKQSAVDDKIIDLNVHSFNPTGARYGDYELEGSDLWDILFPDCKKDRLNAGRLSGTLLKKYSHIDTSAAWGVENIDPLTGKPTGYWRVKFDHPRRGKDGKLVRYESPLGRNTEPIFHKVTRHIWEKIAKKHDTPLPDDFWQMPNEDVTKRFWQWVIEHPEIPLWVVEGEKKTACLLSQGVPAVSVPGINNWHNKQIKDEQGIYKLHPMLEHFAVQGRCFVICFDQDEKPKTRSNVWWAIKKLSKCLESYKSHAFVAHWDGRKGKGIDDYIANGNPLESVKIDSAKKYLGKESNEKLRRLSYTRSLTVNQRYLGEIPLPTNKLVGLKAPKGTGKTELISSWVKMWLMSGLRVLVLTHRTQLGGELSKRLGIPYIEEVASDDVAYWESKELGYILCFDSLRGIARVPFNANKWIDNDKPYVVLLDEAEQSLWHLFNASTSVKDSRVEVIENLQMVLKHAAHIVDSDADLSDLSMDYLAAIANCKNDVSVIENTYQGDGYNCYVFGDNSPNRLVKELFNHIKDMGEQIKEKKILILSGAQKLTSKTSTINLEKKLLETFPDLRVLRIDSESIVDPDHPAFCCLAKLNELIPLYDVIICSSTIETGVSIDKELPIDSVWGIFQGVQSTDGVRQFLRRYRGNCDRFIWVAEVVRFGLVGNGSTQLKELASSQDDLFKATIQVLSSLIDEDLDCVSPHGLDFYYKMGTRINYGKLNYLDQIIDDLEAEGNTVEVIPFDPTDLDAVAMGKELKDNQEKNYDEYNEKTEQALSIDDVQFQRLKKQQQRTESDRLEFRKGDTERKYGKVNVTKKLLEADDKGLLPKLKLLYYLTIGREIVEQKEAAQIRKHSRNSKAWIPDVVKGAKTIKVKALEYSEIDYILTTLNNILDGEFTKDSSILKEIADKAIKARHAIKQVLRVTVSPNMSTLQIVNILLSTINRKMPLLRQERQNGVRVRVYGYPVQLMPIGDDVEREILERWLESDQALLQDDEVKNVA